jgi:hypothetical protein
VATLLRGCIAEAVACALCLALSSWYLWELSFVEKKALKLKRRRRHRKNRCAFGRGAALTLRRCSWGHEGDGWRQVAPCWLYRSWSALMPTSAAGRELTGPGREAGEAADPGVGCKAVQVCPWHWSFSPTVP